MLLREYISSDSDIITSWIKDEDGLYLWSADRICKFPLDGNELDLEYKRVPSDIPMYPLTAIDCNGKITGHILVRFTDEAMQHARLGFVIVSPELRGKGQGQVLVRLALQFIYDNFTVSKITLGVFEKNKAALKCYEACGFKRVGEVSPYDMPIGSWNLIEMELSLK